MDRAPKIKLAKGELQRERILSDEEMRLYLTGCRQPWRDVATIMFSLGMRPGEIYALRWEDMALTEQGFIQVVKESRRQPGVCCRWSQSFKRFSNPGTETKDS